MSRLVVYKSGDFALGDFDHENKRDGTVRYQSSKGKLY